jgi:hypothetical protein
MSVAEREESKRPPTVMEGKKEDIYKLLWAYKYSEILANVPFDIIKIIARLIYFERKLTKSDLVDVLDTVRKWYPCIIMDCKPNSIFIHYYGWSDSSDEWILLTSPRLDPVFTHENSYGIILESHSKNNCEWCAQMHPLCNGKRYWI